MRSKLLVLFSLFFVISIFSFDWLTPKKDKLAKDEYKVIKVNGKIIFKNSGKNLSTGDIFSPSAELKFVTPQSRAAVISNIKGRFVLTADNGSSGSNLLPAMNNVASRSGAILNQIDLKNHFDGNYLVINQVKVKIGKDAFPMDNDNFFYLQYEYNGEPIRKKLSFEGDELIIDKAELFKIDGEPVEPVKNSEMTLYYRKSSEKVSVAINSFVPVFPETEELKEEIKVILEEYSDKDNDKKKDEITAYLNEFYGKPNKDNIDAWLKAEFGL